MKVKADNSAYRAFLASSWTLASGKTSRSTILFSATLTMVQAGGRCLQCSRDTVSEKMDINGGQRDLY